MDINKIERHIDHLKQQHIQLDKELKEELSHFGNETLIHDLKKKKLHIKDEIEKFKQWHTYCR